jgi:uncharacterized protein (DUF169 family)
MITLEGLTKQDIQICNLLWNCDSVEAVDAIVKAMPPAYKTRAIVLRELMTAAALDDVITVDDNVKQYLQTISR